jgi:hypothetical protein
MIHNLTSIFTFCHWRPFEGHQASSGLMRQFWMANFLFLQKLFGGSPDTSAKSVLSCHLRDPFDLKMLENLAKEGEKPKSLPVPMKKTILEFSSKYQPKLVLDPATPQ